MDLILSLDTLVELNDVSYTQSGNTIIAKVGERNYSVKIIDEKTFMFRNISSDGHLGSMIIFGYQEDKPLTVGNYSEKIGDAQYEINLKENNKLDLIKLEADYTISLDKQDLPYFVKGNTLYIDLGDEYICAKLNNVSTGGFIVTNIVNVTKEDGDFTYIHNGNATFSTINEMSVGTYVANQSANADKEESEYKYNTFKFDGNTFTIAMQTSTGYKVYQNLPFKQIGNVYIIGNDEQTKIVMEYVYGSVEMHISATNSIVYERKTDAVDATYLDGHYSYEENGNAVEYTLAAGSMSIYVFMNGESVTIEGGKLYSIGNLTIVLGGTSAIVWLQEDALFGKIWTSSMVSFNETGTMTDLTSGTNIMASEVQDIM